MTALIFILAATAINADPLAPGDHIRKLTVDNRDRTYLVHVPPGYEPAKPVPVVLILHGAGTNAAITIPFTGLNAKADEAGFIAVYPNGTGNDPFLIWNSGGRRGKLAEGMPDDVKFIASVLDDVQTVINVDSRRVYATGMSNGGMMCYRLASELSDRIAAIAPVAGTMAIAEAKPKRPMPVMHFHGHEDTFVPFQGPPEGTGRARTLKSVDKTIEAWRKIDECPEEPVVTDLPDRENDGTTVRRKVYGPGKAGSEVILFEIEGGGHTWPGQRSPISLIGKSTLDISANDLMWEFFQKHPLK